VPQSKVDSIAGTRAGDIFDRCLSLLGVIAAIAVASICTITLADIVSRNVLNVPIRGAFDLSELFLVIVVFLGLPEVFGRQRNIVVDLVDHFASPAVLQVIMKLSAGTSVLFLLILIYAMSGTALDAVHYPEHKQETGIPTWAFWIPIIFGVVCSLVCAVMAMRNIDPKQQQPGRQ
jgi:TRAP-type transport system small permease protein